MARDKGREEKEGQGINKRINAKVGKFPSRKEMTRYWKGRRREMEGLKVNFRLVFDRRSFFLPEWKLRCNDLSCVTSNRAIRFIQGKVTSHGLGRQLIPVTETPTLSLMDGTTNKMVRVAYSTLDGEGLFWSKSRNNSSTLKSYLDGTKKVGKTAQTTTWTRNYRCRRIKRR